MKKWGALGAAFLTAAVVSLPAQAATRIEFMFPAAVQGNLAAEMQKIVDKFNGSHKGIHVDAVFSGGYGATLTKSTSAARVGRPPAVALESANFIADLAINGMIQPLTPFIRKTGADKRQFMQQFWPALRANAQVNGAVYALPFQNSTPVLYYNKTMFKAAGLNPAQPPDNWAEWVKDARRLTDAGKGQWGLIIPSSNGSYLAWLLQALSMANGGQFYNTAFPGEVYLNQPSVVGAMRFWRDLTGRYGVMPKGVTGAKAGTAQFLSGKVGMIVLSTGALSYIRSHATRFKLGVAFVPGNVRRAVPIGGGSLVMFRKISEKQRKAAWTFMQWMEKPAQLGRWSRFTGYFAPTRAAYDVPRMQAYLKQHPSASVAMHQLKYAKSWFAPYKVLEIRRHLVNNMQAVLTGRMKPAEAASRTQKQARQILAPYVAHAQHRSVE